MQTYQERRKILFTSHVNVITDGTTCRKFGRKQSYIKCLLELDDYLETYPRGITRVSCAIDSCVSDAVTSVINNLQASKWKHRYGIQSCRWRYHVAEGTVCLRATNIMRLIDGRCLSRYRYDGYDDAGLLHFDTHAEHKIHTVRRGVSTGDCVKATTNAVTFTTSTVSAYF